MPPLFRLSTGPGRPILAALSGVLLTLAFPRPELWPLAFFGLVPLILARGGLDGEDSFRLGFITGLVHAVTLVYWIVPVMTEYGGLHFLLALPVFLALAAYMALYPGLFAWGLTWAERLPGLKAGGVLWALAGAALWCGLEYFKGFFLTGFPWEPLGAALVAALPLIQVSDIVGPGGLGFLTALVNLALAAVFMRPRPFFRRSAAGPLLLAAAVPVLMWTYGQARLTQVDKLVQEAPVRRMAAVQGSIPQDLKWDPSHRVETMMAYRDLTLKAGLSDPWLTVWPETALPLLYERDPAAREWVDDLVRRAGRPLLFGAPGYAERPDREPVYYNRAYLLDGRAEMLGWYDKSHLVPYGEYVPLQKYFPFLSKITQAVGNYEPGQPGRILDLDGDGIGVLICFESVFPGLARQAVRAGADFLVVITNDAWFGRTSAPYQHFSQAVLRAVETRRSVARAANTGISGFIDPAGRVLGTLNLFQRDVLIRDVPLCREETFYTRTGDIVPQACLAVTILIFGAGFYRRKKNVS